MLWGRFSFPPVKKREGHGGREHETVILSTNASVKKQNTIYIYVYIYFFNAVMKPKEVGVQILLCSFRSSL